ncbi:MAG: hypothetical protein WBC12_04570 [Candidatus Saccharimonas aalborgensis]
MADTGIKQQIVDKIKDSSNILVTVNSNPSVDELSAALGITLLINKLNKHATAVFSGAIPPAISFLDPEKTFESTVDSLRDFIIALDKEKADHLRYKVEGDVVKIFITPYRTTISKDDLDFSQGDYNVEFVLAVGVKNEEDLDKALSAHGRILHDATVAVIALDDSDQKLGGLNWINRDASSFSEMLAELSGSLGGDKKLIDEQIATAFLTGIVAATDRFSNNKTTSKVMTEAAQLMAAGANQQLIATKLEEAHEIAVETPASSSAEDSQKEGDKVESSKEPSSQTEKSADGSLSISHEMQGDIQEVTDQAVAKEQESAANKAEAELAKQTQEVQQTQQQQAAEEAEQKLAEELAQTVPAAAPVPVVNAESLAASTAPVEPQPLRGAVSTDQWRSPSKELAEPLMGGTLNATTEQAAIDKQRELDDDRNRTILSHNSSTYATAPPMFQAPLNAVAQEAALPSEPATADIFSTGGLTSHASMIEPPAPEASAPTLAEIDAQNRADHEDAVNAVNFALGTEMATAPAPALPSPSLPPLPPMPDFSTLPPLPPTPSVNFGATVPDQLGAVLPPVDPAISPAPAQADPAQFKIPGR